MDNRYFSQTILGLGAMLLMASGHTRADAAPSSPQCRPAMQIRVISASAPSIPEAVSSCSGARHDPDATYPAVASRKTSRAAPGQPTSSGQRPKRTRKPRPLPEDNDAVRECVAKASGILHVPATVLYLLLDVEAGPLGGSVLNTNGTRDIGPMQVNSTWLPRFLRMGVTESDLTNDLCINIMAGAWIYANARHESGSTAMAIARYHSPTPVHQDRYLGLVESAIQRRLDTRPDESSAPQVTPAPAPCLRKTKSCLMGESE